METVEHRGRRVVQAPNVQRPERRVLARHAFHVVVRVSHAAMVPNAPKTPRCATGVSASRAGALVNLVAPILAAIQAVATARRSCVW